MTITSPHRMKIAVLTCAAVALLLSCTPPVSSGHTAKIRFSFTGPGSVAASSVRAVDSHAGDSGTSGLTSLKYFVSGITLYTDIVPNGSGFDIPDDAKQLILYDSAGWKPGDSFDFETADAKADQYVDVLDPIDRARLTKTASIPEDGAGTWNWAVITVAPVVRLTGSVDLGDGITLYTHPGTQTTASYPGQTGGFPVVRSSTPLSGGPAAETKMSVGGGGMYYRLQKPLVITQEDIDAEVQFLLNFAVETEGTLQGWKAGETNTFTDHSSGAYFLGYDDEEASGVYNEQIFAPNLNIVPILVRSTDTVMREHYVITYSGLNYDNKTSADVTVVNDILLNLYWIGGDTDRSIVGLELNAVAGSHHQEFTSLETVPMDRFATPFTYDTDETGALSLYDFLGDPIIRGFVRLGAVGDGTDMPELVTSHGSHDTMPEAVDAASYSLVSLGEL